MKRASIFLLSAAAACGGGNAGLNQTSITCSQGRTLLDGVCVSEQVADYVSCVRAQGAQLGSERGQKLSADVGSLGVRAGGAAELNETLQKRYSVSDQAMLAIVQACGAATGQLAATAKPDAKTLAARWPFDEESGAGASDATGHGNTAQIVGTGAWVAGRVGGALKLDGQSRLDVPDSPTQHAPRAVTLTGWFLLARKDTGQPWRSLFIKTDPKGKNSWGCLDVGVPDPNPCDAREYGADVNVDNMQLDVYGVTEDHYQNGGVTWCATASGAVRYETWHHFAGVISPKSRAIRIFLDGALMTTCPLSEAGLRRTSSTMVIGSGWVGMLDDFRIYGDELSADDIAALAAAK